MSKTLNILEENAIKAYNGADEKGKGLLSNLFGKEVFNRKITDRVKSFADVLAIAGLTENDFYKDIKGMAPDTIAYEEIKLIARVLNEGWTPDWDNSSQYKYYPYFKKQGSGFVFYVVSYYHSATCAGSRLCFRTTELAEHAGRLFQDNYNTFLNIP